MQRLPNQGGFRAEQTVQSVTANTTPRNGHEPLTKSPATSPDVLPAQQTPQTHEYEIFIAADGVGASQGVSFGSPLQPGDSFVMEAGLFPEKWRINAYAMSGTQLLWVKAGRDAGLPAEFLVVGTSGVNAAQYPARGRALTVRADPANTAPIVLTGLATAGIAL